MKQNLILIVFALQMILPVTSWADGETYYSDFTYSYNGVSYKVSFVDREAHADGLADYRNMTDVKIQGFSLKGSDIYAIMKIATNGRLDMGGEAVDLDKTYSFKATMVRQGFKNSAVTSVQMENTVTTIMPDAFMSCTGLKSIQLSSGISEIPQNCFKGCSKLSAITIPANIKSIGYEAFRACSSLSTVSLSYGLQTIAEGAFDSCSGLASIELPNSVSEVGAGAFIDCRSLESVTISDNLKQIATTTFLGCEKLSAVVFGENSQLEKIGMMAFADCNSLKEFNMPDKLKTLESSNMGSSPFGKSAYDYTGDPIEKLKISDAISASSLSTMMSEIKGTLTTVTFGKKPTLKNLDILKGCERLQSVEIPASITSLSAKTFYYAQNLKEINSNIESPFTITDDVFNSNTYNTATLHVPVGSKSKYQATAGWKNFKEINETSGGDIIVPDENGTPEPYATLSDDNKTLTFYYDGKKESRNGMSIGPFQYNYPNGVDSGWYGQREIITNVVFDASFANYSELTSTAYWFYGCNKLIFITGIENLNTSNVTKMDGMFYECSSLTSLDVSNFNTANVTSMSSMFSQCSGLKSLDVTNFNTANVTSMGSMFSYCSGLKSLDVTNFNTSNVTYMRNMFSFCSGLTSLDVSNFNTSKVKDMAGMFWTCSGLTSLDLSNFNTANVTDMQFMFEGCLNLKNLYVKNFNTSKVTNMSRMFEGCYLTSIDVSNFNTNNVTNMSYMFNSCHLTSLDVSNFNTNNVTNMEFMFQGTSVTTLDLSNFNTSKVTNMEYMFAYSYSLTTIYCNDVWTSINSTDMFKDCASLKGAINFDSSKTDITYANPTTGYFTKKSDKTNDLKDGDTFTAKTIEGVEMTFKVLSASDKTCQVGTGQGISIDKEYSGSITIPETINGFRVTTVAFEAFGSSKINSVVIGNNVTYIEQNAFISCQWLKSISFPNNNGFSLGFWPFQGCTSLETITLPKNLTSMDCNPFMGCSSLSYIGVDENNPNYKSVDGVVYSKDTKAIYAYPCGRPSTEYEIINGTQVIGMAAFSTATKMEKIHIPNSVTRIYGSAFFACTNLKALILPPDITYIPYDLATFSGITEVVIPNKVTSIESSAFSVCNRLTLVKVEIEEPLAIDENTFSNRANATLYVPKGCVDVYSKANYWKEFKEIKEIDGGDDDAELKDGDTFTAKTVEGVEMTFKVISASNKTCQVGGIGGTGLEASIDKEYSGSITIPETINGFRVVTVAFNAFYGCKINTVIIGNNVTYIDQNAFLSCQRLKSVTFPNNNGFRLKYWSFQGCPSLETITLPRNLTSMDGSPFLDCPSLYYIGVEEDNPNYKSIDGVVYSKDSKVIWAYPCGRPSTEYEIIDGTQVIGRAAFMSASKLERIHIPNSVTRIDDSAFWSCTNLKTLILPPDLTSIPNGLATFSNKITEISIPNKVTSIGNGAFQACHSLTSVRVEIEEPLAIDEYTFSARANATLYVPRGSVDAYSKADYWKDFKQIMPIGDANGDGAIDDADVEEAADFIMDRPSETFVEAAADMNGDGVVNVIDVVLMNAIKTK